MITRLAIVVLLSAAFAKGFSEIAARDNGPEAHHGAHPCEEWSNPQCNRAALP